MNNLINIEFLDKKAFHKGPWMSEPDICAWEHKLPCLALRDMSLGIWRGFAALTEGHPFYGRIMEELIKIPQATEIFLSTYGGISGVGRLPTEYARFDKNYWWVSVATIHGGDLVPLLKMEDVDANMAKMMSNQTYKNLKFIRREVNKLAESLARITSVE